MLNNDRISGSLLDRNLVDMHTELAVTPQWIATAL